MGGTGDELPVYIPPWRRDPRERIRKSAERREIRYLVHFTQLDNVPSILEHGLLSRRELDERGIPYRWNDENRLDKALDAISLSISFPNYRMFFPLRKKNGEARWAVLMLDRSILWKYKCAYYYTNAASGELRDEWRGDLQSPEAFERVFASEIEGRSRAKEILKYEYYTTDPQAEVLVFQPIPPERVFAVCVENYEDLESLELLIRGCNCQKVRIEVFKKFFGPREDYERWRNQENENEKDIEPDDEDIPF